MDSTRFSALLVAGALACSSGQRGHSEGEEYAGEEYAAIPDMIAPDGSGCDIEPVELGVCTWAAAADRVVWGEVTDVNLTSYPAVMIIDGDDPPWITVESCRYGIIPAMQLKLRVEQDLFGTGEEEIIVHFGARHVQQFSPHPTFDSSGHIRWGIHDTIEEPRKGIAVGARLGIAARFMADEGIWSAMGEPLFALTEARTLTAQTPEQCVIYPSVLYGGTFSDLEAGLSSCSAADLSAPATLERKRRVGLRWGPEWFPALAYAPECIDGSLSPFAGGE
jgi:hypothetical protein